MRSHFVRWCDRLTRVGANLILVSASGSDARWCYRAIDCRCDSSILDKNGGSPRGDSGRSFRADASTVCSATPELEARLDIPRRKTLPRSAPHTTSSCGLLESQLTNTRPEAVLFEASVIDEICTCSQNARKCAVLMPSAVVITESSDTRRLHTMCFALRPLFCESPNREFVDTDECPRRTDKYRRRTDKR